MDAEKLAGQFLEALCSLARTPVREIKGISGGELGTMGFLAASGGAASPSELSRFFQISTARVANILRGLEKKGYVERRLAGGDGRRITVTLTEAGQAMADEHTSLMRRDIRRLLEALGDEDAETLLRLTRRLTELLQTCPLESVAAQNTTGRSHS